MAQLGLNLSVQSDIAVDLLVAVGDAADDDHVGVIGVLGIAVPVGQVDLVGGVGVAVGVAENLPALLLQGERQAGAGRGGR